MVSSYYLHFPPRKQRHKRCRHRNCSEVAILLQVQPRPLLHAPGHPSNIADNRTDKLFGFHDLGVFGMGTAMEILGNLIFEFFFALCTYFMVL